MSVLETVGNFLEVAAYRTRWSDDELRFEDQSVLGFAVVFDAVAELLNTWRERQDRFLRNNASQLRQDARKSWNVYSVLLTSQVASDEEIRRLMEVEEDFRATRKVARAAILAEHDVESAIAVLLPVRHRVNLAPEDARARVTERLKFLPPQAVDLLMRGGSVSNFVESLLREEET